MSYERVGVIPDLLERGASGFACPSFDAAFSAHRARVFGLCRKLLQSREDAEDALQEAMLRAYNAWPRFRTGDDPWPWLATIASNVCRDLGRRTSRAAAYVATIDLDEEYSPDAYEDAARRVRCDLVQEALASVPPRYRTPLYLRDIEGWSVAEIARVRGRTVPSVRSSLTRARKLLATRVEELARARHQWPLPAIAPIAGRLRTRVARVKAASDRAAVSGWLQIDSAISTFTSVRFATVLHVAAAAAAAAALSLTGNANESPPGASSPGTHSGVYTRDAPIRGDAQPSKGASARSRPDSGARATTLALGAPRVNDGRRTETPTATATPGAPPVGDDAGVWVGIGPVGMDCSSPERQSATWQASCDALALVPIPPLRVDAEED